MSLRLATFNIENLLTRSISPGFATRCTRIACLNAFRGPQRGRLSAAGAGARGGCRGRYAADDGAAIADADADIICLQEVDNMAALQAFEKTAISSAWSVTATGRNTWSRVTTAAASTWQC